MCRKHYLCTQLLSEAETQGRDNSKRQQLVVTHFFAFFFKLTLLPSAGSIYECSNSFYNNGFTQMQVELRLCQNPSCTFSEMFFSCFFSLILTVLEKLFRIIIFSPLTAEVGGGCSHSGDSFCHSEPSLAVQFPQTEKREQFLVIFSLGFNGCERRHEAFRLLRERIQQ